MRPYRIASGLECRVGSNQYQPSGVTSGKRFIPFVSEPLSLRWFAFYRVTLPTEKSQRDVPVLAAISDHRDGFLVVTSQHTNHGRPAFRLKGHPVANAKVQHLRVRPHLAEKPQSFDDPVVQINQFLFREFVDV
jgi:hypothetical protein